MPKIFHWSNGFSSTAVRRCGNPGGRVTSTSRAKNISLVQWFLIGLCSLVRQSRRAGLRAHLMPKIFHWSNGFSSTAVRRCGNPGGRVTSTSRAKNISLVQWFLIGWRTRPPPRLRWFRLGSGRVGCNSLCIARTEDPIRSSHSKLRRSDGSDAKGRFSFQIRLGAYSAKYPSA